MKRIALLLCIVPTLCLAGTSVNPYLRKDGTYVQPHYRSSPDRNPYNNYSTKGNSNPYTGSSGQRDPYKVQQEYKAPKNPYPEYGAQPRRSW